MKNEAEKKRVPIPSLEQLEAERDRNRKQTENRKLLIATLGALLVVAAASVLISTSVLPVLQVSGNSMEPTLENGEILLILKTEHYRTGDVIAFYYQSKVLVKRVIARAGDYIDIDEAGNVYVNDQMLEEPYLTGKSLGEYDIDLPYQVPDGKLFVMGDNRSVSMDSRSSVIGCVAEEQIIGKTIFRIWPFSHIGKIH